MKTLATSHRSLASTMLFIRPAHISGSFAAVLAAALLLSPSSVHAGGVVTNCTEAALRAALVGGGTVTFACDGAISLASTITITADTVLDARGHQVTISGGGTVRVFVVNYATLALLSLTVAQGVAFGPGGTNGASYDGPNPAYYGLTGGAGGGGSPGLGGAIYCSGWLIASNSSFVDNSAFGGAGGNGGYGGWGTASLNGGVGGQGGDGADGQGGALFIDFTNGGSAWLVNCTFSGNICAGGPGGDGGPGGYNPYSGFTTGGGGGAAGRGGSGGRGLGGAISGPATLVNCEFDGNRCLGSTGGDGGTGGGIVGDNHGSGAGAGGAGGQGGSGFGSALNGSNILVNCTLGSNSCAGGSGGGGGTGGYSMSYGYPGRGGDGGNGGSANGVTYPYVTLTNCTIAFNSGTPGTGGSAGQAGFHQPCCARGPGAPGAAGTAFGGVTAGTLVNTLLATNSPAGNGIAITDLGHNLSSDGSYTFTTASSKANANPKLAPPSYNGGPSLTMALLPGSPAIDMADTSSAPATDQRGVPRPVGPAPDIGAFEFGWPAYLLLTCTNPGIVNLVIYGNTGQSCRLLVSSNLLDWISMATNQIGTNGTYLFQDNCSPGGTCRFYRLVMP